MSEYEDGDPKEVHHHHHHGDPRPTVIVTGGAALVGLVGELIGWAIVLGLGALILLVMVIVYLKVFA